MDQPDTRSQHDQRDEARGVQRETSDAKVVDDTA